MIFCKRIPDPPLHLKSCNEKNYTLLSDCCDVNNFEASAFSLTWSSRWYPQLYAKFFRGSFYENDCEATTKAFSAVGHLNLHKNKMYLGENIRDFDWTPGSGWSRQLALNLTQEEDLSRFYIQGNTNAPEITENGLLIETTPYCEAITRKSKAETDTDQIYLWSDRTYEGDICIEYEFNPLQHGGLSLLIANASGMQREDFMSDYPLRVTGSMQMVCWEDVRNYHWEYFREVTDTRNDTASHVLLKNPWLRPMAYRCMTESLEIGTWHKLQYLQQGRTITCAIDSTVVMQVTDDPFNNNGPCFDFGRFAIRCMMNTKMLFRNLQVFNRSII